MVEKDVSIPFSLKPVDLKRGLSSGAVEMGAAVGALPCRAATLEELLLQLAVLPPPSRLTGCPLSPLPLPSQDACVG